ncbi:MAG: hypothetical protein LUD76_08320 [Alistipes sp.]|nr:hypothetical protein [Alistipes sp.]
MMKNIKLLALFLSVLLVGCNDDDTEVAKLTVISSDVEFSAAGGDGTIRIDSPGTVTAVSDKEWLSITNQSQNEVTFNVSPSGEIMSRTANITITYGGQSENIAVNQLGEIFVTSDLDGLKFTAKAETYILDFYSNSGTLKVSADQDWVSVSYSEGQLSITLDTNDSRDDRLSVITLSGGWKEEQITITQSGFLIFAEDTIVSLPYSGKRDYILELTEDIELFPSDWTVTVDGWVTAVKAADGRSITFSADANNTGVIRSSKIVIAGGDFVVETDIVQGSVPVSSFVEQREWFFDISKATGVYATYFPQLKSQVSDIGEIFSELSFFPYPTTYGTHVMYFEFEYSALAYYVMYTYYVKTTTEDEFMTTLEFGFGVAGYGAYYRPLLPIMDQIVTLGINGNFIISEADNYADPTVLRFEDVNDANNTFVMTTEEIRYP